MGAVKPRERTVDALELIVAQHDQVDALIAEIQNEALIERKQFLFDELVDRIAAHAAMEEKLFYPTVHATQTQEILPASAEAHHAIKRALADLVKTDVDDAAFDAKLAVLAEEIEQHAREEEEQILFPKLRRLMSTEQLEALGSEMLALYERLMTARPHVLQVAAERGASASV